MNYNKMTDDQKKSFIENEYSNQKKSFADIASAVNTYANKIRRDAIKFNIKIRDKSEAQTNALKTGKTSHPTQGKKRSETTKQKIGQSVMESWEGLSEEELNRRKTVARLNWEKLDDNTKDNILREANAAVRTSSKIGSKLERFLFQELLKDGYVVEFHKEQNLLNTKLQIDIFLPILNVAIEVDGPSHFEPVWGSESLKRNQGYDNKKTGLILGKGLVLVRIKQSRDYSAARARSIYSDLKTQLQNIEKQFPSQDNRIINLGD